MTAHAISYFVLPTTDTIVGGLSAVGSRNLWPRARTGEPHEPAGEALSDLEQPWLRTVLEEIGAIADLKEDWDGYGAGPIRTDVLWYALILLQSVMDDFPAPQVTPMSHEGVLLEWLRDGVHLEVEIEDAGEAHVSYENERCGISNAWEVKTNFASLLEPLRVIAEKAPAPTPVRA